MGLVRVAVPTHAYVVKGALQTRDKPRGFGATVHVVRLPGKGSPARTFWDTSWEGAIRRAADHATKLRSCPAPACAARPGRAGAGTGSHPTCCTPTSAAPSWRTRAATTRHSTATTRRCAKTR